jgi:hypothetical protein
MRDDPHPIAVMRFDHVELVAVDVPRAIEPRLIVEGRLVSMTSVSPSQWPFDHPIQLSGRRLLVIRHVDRAPAACVGERHHDVGGRLHDLKRVRQVHGAAARPAGST